MEAMPAAETDPICMYLIVRVDVDIVMSAGKMCAQVAHATGMLMDDYWALKNRMYYEHSSESMARLRVFDDWRDTNYRKVVIRANNKEWEKLKADYPDHVLVIDAGFTQVAPSTETVIGLWPQYKSKRSNTLKWLQAL